MDVKQIKASRFKAARNILEILKNLENETEMFVSYVNTDGETDFDGKSQGLETVSIDLTLE